MANTIDTQSVSDHSASFTRTTDNKDSDDPQAHQAYLVRFSLPASGRLWPRGTHA